MQQYRKVGGVAMEEEKGMTVTKFLTKFADSAPYFLGVGAGTVHTSDAARMWTIVSQVLHIALWTTVMILDALLLRDKFDDAGHAYCHTLMLGAFVPLTIAAVFVVTLTFVHVVTSVAESKLNFNDGHLPAFATTSILGTIRASHMFTMLLIMAWTMNGSVAANAIDEWTRNVLVTQLVLKQMGISFTANAHRFAVPGGYIKAE